MKEISINTLTLIPFYIRVSFFLSHTLIQMNRHELWNVLMKKTSEREQKSVTNKKKKSKRK